MTQEIWPETLTKVQGALIAHHRERRGLTHAELVKQVQALGLTLQRTTLVNIEQGRRKSLSVPEVFAFAYALQIPPILLLAPVGNVESIEVLKDKMVQPWTLAQWIRGDGVLDAPIDGTIPREGPLREQFDALMHHSEVLMWHRFLESIQHEILVLGQRLDGAQDSDEIRSKIWQLQSWRNRIREAGLVAPPIWPEIQALHPEIY